MRKGDILQAQDTCKTSNCVHYVVFLEKKDDGQSFVGACISSKPSKDSDLIYNEKLEIDDFEPITPENGFKVTYGNCPDGSKDSYLCVCNFTKELKWFVDENSNVKVVGQMTPQGIKKIENSLRGKPEIYFPYPISEINIHPEYIIFMN